MIEHCCTALSYKVYNKWNKWIFFFFYRNWCLKWMNITRLTHFSVLRWKTWMWVGCSLLSYWLSFAQYLHFVKKTSHKLLKSIINWGILFSLISNACSFSSAQAGHMSPSTLLFVLYFSSNKLWVFLSPFFELPIKLLFLCFIGWSSTC